MGCGKIKIWEGEQLRREINRERKEVGAGKREGNERKVMEEEGKWEKRRGSGGGKRKDREKK